MRCPTCNTELLDDAICCPICGETFGEETCDESHRYEAFISYRHIESDIRVAKYIQNQLEGFRIPKELQRKAERSQLGKLFRDEDELPAGGSLTDRLIEALRDSRFLIVICSPQAVESQWVSREIEAFISLHGRNHVLAVLTDGDPETSYPEPLHFTAVPDTPNGNHSAELIAADFRHFSGSLTREERRHTNREILRLAAPIIGCNLDDLAQRQKERHTRLITRAAIAAASIGIAFGGFALWQRSQIEQNYRAMQESQSEYLAKEAKDLYAEGKRMEAIQVAMAALPSSQEANDRAFTPAAQEALAEALNVYPSSPWLNMPSDWFPLYAASDEAYLDSLCVSDQGLWFALPQSGEKIRIIDVQTGTTTSVVEPPEPQDDNAGSYLPASTLAANETSLFLSNGYREVTAFEASSGKQLWSTPKLGEKNGLTVIGDISKDGTRLFALSGTSESITSVIVLNAKSGDIISSTDIEPLSWNRRSFSVNQDGSVATVSAGNSLRIIDVTDSTSISATSHEAEINSVNCLGANIIVASSPEPSEAYSYESASTIGSTQITSSATSATIEGIDKKTGRSSWQQNITWNSYRIEESDLPFNLPATITDVIPLSNDEGILSVSAGSQLIIFLASNGKNISREIFESPIVDAWTALKQAGPVYNVMTYQGIIHSVDLFQNQSQSMVGMNMGAIGYGHHFQVSGKSSKALFLVRPITEPNSLVTYSLTAHTDLPGYKGTNEFIGGAMNSDRSLVAEFHSNGDKLGILDTKSLVLSELSLTDLGISLSSLDSATVDFSRTDPNILFILDKGNEETHPAIWRIDISDGKVTDSWPTDGEQNEGLTAYSRILPERNGQITVSMPLTEACYILDAKNLEVIDKTWAPPLPSPENNPLAGRTKDRLIIGDSILTLSGNANAVTLSHRNTDEKIDAFDEVMLDEDVASFGSSLAIAPDESMFALATSDGMLSTYDSENGKKLWDTPFNKTSTYHLEYDEDGNYLFAQDGSDLFSILDAKTGQVVSSLQLADVSVRDIQESSSDRLLFLHGSDSANTDVLTVVSREKDKLSKLATIPLACAVLPGEEAVLCSDATSTFTLPLYSLDELLAMGNEAIKGHELTEEQKRQYYLE